MRQYRQIDKPSRDTTHNNTCKPEASVMADFCRGCLTIHEKPAELLQFTEKNRRLFVYSTGIQVKRNDSIMFQLCKDCYVNMLMSCKFKKQCRTSDKKFKHYVALKEVGDAYDLSSFLKSNEETLRFPSLSGSSTPANQRIRDDDNESTCTSIRNFMSDILQGEEMPDSEARIIKEVIEEETDVLDDSLDSQWLQDDVSIDTDFRLDFSFSPFSTPQSTNVDHCYTPNKQLDTGISNFKCVTGKSFVQSPIDRKGKKKQSIKQYAAQLQTAQETSETTDAVRESVNEKDKDDDEERETLFNEIIDHNVNYVTQNENDIAVTNIQDDNIRNESYYAAQALQTENDKYYASRECEQNNKYFSALKEKQMAVKHILESNNEVSTSVQSTNFSSHNNMAVKNIDQKIVDNNQSEITFTLKHDSGDIVVQVNKMTSDEKQSNQQHKEDESHSTGTYKDVPLTEDINDDTKYEHSLQVLHKNYTVNIEYETEGRQRKDILEEAFNNKKEFRLEDMLISPAAYQVVPGASTPTINNILFGDRLDVDEDNNKTIKTDNYESESEVDVLDEILNQGVKEFSIHTLESQAADVYDLEQSYCRTCDKKFKSTKALKVHLTKFHGIKLPKVKSKDSDKQTRICPVCADTYDDYRNYIRHVKTHAKEVSQKECSKCKLIFSSENKLKAHMKSHDAFQPVENKIKAKKYLCMICGHSTDVTGNFSIHMKRHARKYVARCDECGRGFYRKSELEHHLRIHTGELPFPCKQCDKRFRQKYSLVKHMSVHLVERPFQCDHCSRQFALRSDIVIHLKNSRLCKKARSGMEPKRDPPPKKYECFYCNDKFTNKPSFIKHQKNFNPCKTLHKQNRIKKNTPKVVLPVLSVASNESNIAI